MSEIEKFLQNEFGDSSETPLKQDVGEGGLRDESAIKVDPVREDLRKIRNILRGCCRHTQERFKDSHGQGLCKQLRLGEKMMDRVIKEIETGVTLTGPLVRRNAL